jgi:hypothetical protein|tara:strand:- start:189 stop:455 length:267 start_codon:yes stop_codon:yes gene_type:complete
MINYISASESQVQLWDEAGIVASSSSANDLANVIFDNGGFADAVYASSSVDFASEEGFDTDEGANELLESAIVIFNNFTLHSSLKNAK